MTSAGRLADLIRDATGSALPVRLRSWDGTEAGPRDAPVLVVRNRRALRRLLWAPNEVGITRAYIAGDVDIEGDLGDALRRVWQAARARPSADARVSRLKVATAAARLGALGPPPTPPVAEGRRTEPPRDFYELLLDEHMAFSAAYFPEAGLSLHDAQTAKLDLVCRKLGLREGMRLLDIGCGWGSLILHAAEHYGVHATGLTLSEEQRGFVAVRASERGLSDAVEVRRQDHREFSELPEAAATFDAVSSIESPTHAAVMFDVLKPRGRLVLQERAQPLWQTVRHLQEAGFEIRAVEAMREHYVRTVDAWLEVFETHHEQFVDLVGPEVTRMWRLHLVGDRLAFEEGRMSVDQVLAVKTTASGVSGF